MTASTEKTAGGGARAPAKPSSGSPAGTVNVSVIGASGYVGVDTVRLLLGHPQAHVAQLTAHTHAGAPAAACWPHLAGMGLPDFVAVEDAVWDGVDVAISALPHGMGHQIIANLPGHLKVMDLSADFRLRDAAVYEAWYGRPHGAPALQDSAVYGLSEHNRNAIAQARLVACPGCYPTAVLLALLPLVGAGLLELDDIIVDAKSGVTGAGRKARTQNLFAEAAEGLHPYAVAAHRHTPEIEQELSRCAGAPVRVSFTPHLAPMNRGELVTIYVRPAARSAAADLRAALADAYAAAPFVRVAAEGAVPATRHVRGSNFCDVAVFDDRLPGRAIIVAALDNLVKGSGGQAVQNMNLMCGFDETAGLMHPPLFP